MACACASSCFAVASLAASARQAGVVVAVPHWLAMFASSSVTACCRRLTISLSWLSVPDAPDVTLPSEACAAATASCSLVRADCRGCWSAYSAAAAAACASLAA